MEDTPAIAAARQAYYKAAMHFEYCIARRATVKQALIDAQARLNQADERYDEAAQAADNMFEALRLLVAEAKAVQS